MQRQNLVDLLPVVDAGFETGGEDHVFEDRHREGIAGGLDELVGLFARQAERKGEGDRRALPSSLLRQVRPELPTSKVKLS